MVDTDNTEVSPLDVLVAKGVLLKAAGNYRNQSEMVMTTPSEKESFLMIAGMLERVADRIEEASTQWTK